MHTTIKIILILFLIAHLSAIKANFPGEKSEKVNNNKNSADSLYMPVQVSFVPNFGTCGFHTDKLTTNVSINILVGKIYEVKSTEIGGIINIVQNNAGHCQLAGIGNFVHGQSFGFQGAGIINTTKTLNGIQVAGITNSAEKASGMQIAGIVNHASQGKCAQLAGIINSSRESATFQIASILNYAPEVDQFQLSGLVNNCKHTRFQITGLVNHSEKTDQFQIAGLVNNTADATWFQIAGLVNKALEVKNIQLAGILNKADNVAGNQISGIVNKATYVKGVQIGLINIADSCGGVPIGLINIVKNGYHTIELSGDELLYTNIAFRSGVKKLHGIVTAGIKPDDFITPRWTYGVGLGNLFSIGRNTNVGTDMMFQNMVKNGYVDNNYLYKIGAGIDQRISKKFSIYCGVSYNVLQSKTNQNNQSEIYSSTAPYHFFEKEYKHFTYKNWIGFKLGLRLN
jgi:hypothetical protein